METKITYILQHRVTQLFISHAPDSYHTKKLTHARRFMDMDQLHIWLQASCYAPENADEYEARPLKITYELESVDHANSQS